ncbi:hypothetical protein DOT_1877 [Desulfosporosinus sp. OT]|nr:hypothetical protein DOT_1877 [Desulfosporosinus sp. OT]
MATNIEKITVIIAEYKYGTCPLWGCQLIRECQGRIGPSYFHGFR